MFPLNTFLHALESDGIRITVRDYDRIARVLGCNDGWTLARLRDVLLGLLAKDLNQCELLGRRFDEFFNTDLTVPETDPVDMAGLRAELRNFRKDRALPQQKPRQKTAAPSLQPVPSPKDPRRWQRLALLLTVAGLAAGLFIAGWMAFSPDPPILHLTVL